MYWIIAGTIAISSLFIKTFIGWPGIVINGEKQAPRFFYDSSIDVNTYIVMLLMYNIVLFIFPPLIILDLNNSFSNGLYKWRKHV
jgi:hypothetical protein